MNNLLSAINAKKSQLDQLRFEYEADLTDLQKHHDAELTYNSNAIEGNRFTLTETVDLLFNGKTVLNKSLREHLEVIDHFATLNWLRETLQQESNLDIDLICQVHQRLFGRIQPEKAGILNTESALISSAITHFSIWLEQAPPNPSTAFEALTRLLAIKPFYADNDRTARLVMNFLLLRFGYIPLAIKADLLKTYQQTLNAAIQQKDTQSFQDLMHSILDNSLSEYILVIEVATLAKSGIAP